VVEAEAAEVVEVAAAEEAGVEVEVVEAEAAEVVEAAEAAEAEVAAHRSSGT
jgi:hypothetical protein